MEEPAAPSEAHEAAGAQVNGMDSENQEESQVIKGSVPE
uniref:Makorin ring finger protein 3 n=1 Tax=Homo sapiens TaxID=9606 RepID=A0A3B3IRN4_HUMAN